MKTRTAKSDPVVGRRVAGGAAQAASTGGALQPGALYVVATPLGNLGDITVRALGVLAAADLIAAEDTRRTRVLLAHYGLRTPLEALHAHNEATRSAALVEKLRAGCSIALVSDAGTPLLADPGFPLVRAARAAGCPVLTVPGPCAAIAALSIAGLPAERFVFEGFLPARAGARRSALEALREQPRTLVLYEAPHRIEALVRDAGAVLGAQRGAVLLKELTKVHETAAGPDLGAIATWLAADGARRKGEFVLVIAGAPAPRPGAAQDSGTLDALLERLVPALGVRLAADAAAALAGVRRNVAYRRALGRPCRSTEGRAHSAPPGESAG
jgi:16S rRNA (cytidine1402-2'-O)-methyltransferase